MVFDHIGLQKANSWNCDDLAHRSTLGFLCEWVISLFFIVQGQRNPIGEGLTFITLHYTFVVLSKSLLALYQIQPLVYSNRGFIQLFNSPLMARNIQSSFEQGAVFCLACCLQKTSRKTPHKIVVLHCHCAGHLIRYMSVTSQTTGLLFHRNTIQTFIDCFSWGVIP